MTEKKELSKSQRKRVFFLFVDFVSLPMTIAVLLAGVATYDASPSLMEFMSILCAVVAVPLLSVSIFARKGAESLNPKVVVNKLPASVEWVDSLGFGSGATALIFYIASVHWLLGLLFVLVTVIAFLSQYGFLLDQRE